MVGRLPGFRVGFQEALDHRRVLLRRGGKFYEWRGHRDSASSDDPGGNVYSHTEMFRGSKCRKLRSLYWKS